MQFFWRKKSQRETVVITQPTTVAIGDREHLVESPYLLPVDPTDDQRLDLQHFMLRWFLKGNYCAPLAINTQQILDVGCGTGRWASEMAREFPRAQVVGLDIKPPNMYSLSILGGQAAPPVNLCILQRNVMKDHLEQGWEDKFDFVHMRLMVMALPKDQWFPVVNELVRVTKPDGWVELVDGVIGGEVNTPAWSDYYKLLTALAKNYNLDFKAGQKLASYLKLCGLQDVRTMRVDVPFGHLRGRVGEMMAANAVAGVAATKPRLVDAGLITEEDFDALEMALQRDLWLVDTVQPFFVSLGRKS